MLLTSGFVQQQFRPFFLRRANVWVCAGNCTLGENVTSSTHRLGAAADHLTLSVSLTPTYVGKSDHVSDFHSFVKSFDRSNHCVSLQALHFCKAYMLHKHTYVVMWCEHWKIPFYSQQVVRRERVHLD